MECSEVVFTAPRKAVIEQHDLPEPGEGQVLIRTYKTLISTGTELTAFTGDFPPDSFWSRYIRYPWQAGYSNVGEIVSAGPGVEDFEVGQRVVSFGRHATCVLQDVTRVQPVPSGVSDEEAVFWTLGCTVMNGVRLASVSLGEAVVLVGAGILGQLATQYTTMCGGFPVIVVDLSDERLNMARKHGATHTLIGGRDELNEDIRRITRGRMADVAFEITGNQKVIPSLFRMVRRLGRVILLGSPRGSVEVDFHDEVHKEGLHIIGGHISTHPEFETAQAPWTRARNGELFFDLVSAGRLKVDDMVSHRYSWRDAALAYEMLADDRTQAMGVILEGWDE